MFSQLKIAFAENIPSIDDEVFSPGQLTLESDDDSPSVTAGGESDLAHGDVNDSSEETRGDQADRWGDTLVFTLDNSHSGWCTDNIPDLHTSIILNLATATNKTEHPEEEEDDGGDVINVIITRPTSQQQLVKSIELPSTEISKVKSESL